LKTVPQGKLGQFAGLNPPVEFGPLHVAAPLAIIQWRLAPGATLPAHNHNPADIISLCIEGECIVRHFDIEGSAPDYSSKETFLIRETRNDLLTPGRMSSLSTRRDNIHTFRAGKEGAMGIDINSILPGDKPFSFLEFADKPRDPQKRIYEAVWKKL
jgi:predicted metal-dependent enzyme (double-stranded beta helix superfamily)